MKKTVTVLAALAGLLIPAASAYTTNDINGILAEFPAGTVHQHQMIPMRDGIRLSTYCFLPAGHAVTNYPVVLVRSAYNDWNQRRSYANDVVDRTDTNNLKWINTNGYVYVFQDLRGDGESQTNANFEPRLSENEINDTYDTVEALATNAWSNGRVGMYGSSGHGVAAYMGWLSKAPHLVVASPGNTGPNLYEHWSFENGVRRWIYNWLQYRNSNGTVMPVWPKPTSGDYYTNTQWQQTLREGAVSNSTILMASDAWHNYFLDSTFEAFTALNSGHKAFIKMDHGTHQGDIGLTFTPKPSGFLNIPTVFQILDGVPFTNAPTLKYFVMGDARRAAPEGNFYRLAYSWPPPAVTTPYYFHADGALSTAMPVSDTNTLSYSYHPTNPVPSVGGNYSFGTNPVSVSGPLNQLVSQLTNRTDILRFETAPFTNTVEITGRLQARLYISTDVPDTTFMVKLIDVYPAEGTNAEYYAIMRESATMARYWSGPHSPSPLTTGQVYRLDIDMSSIALMIETNHRVAVHITSSSGPAFEIHPNTYTQVMDFAGSPTAHNTLHLNSQYPSMIRLPMYNTGIPSVLFSTNRIQVTEGGTAQFNVQLSAAASSAVTVRVERVSADPDINVSSGAALVFTPENWSVPQTVTLSATQDADGVDSVTDIEASGPGVAAVLLIAGETDDDPFIIPAASTLDVPESGTAALGFTLSRAPVSAVTVTASRISGDTDLSVSGVSNFVFTSGNWNTTQAVSFAAAEDADTLWSTALFRFSSDRAFSADVTVREQDNDRSPLRIDFGATGSQVETNGAWQAFAASSTEPKPSTRTYTIGASNVSITLNSSGTLAGKDRSNPASNTGSLTYAGVYRDMVYTSLGEITLAISGLTPQGGYILRGWHYDYQYLPNAVFSVTNTTDGANTLLGQTTNVTSTGGLPTNNLMYSWSAAVTSSASGTLTLLISGSGANSARINGLEMDEIIPPVQNWTLTVGVNNPAWGSVSPTGGLFTAGSNVQITATASNYYHFAEWTGDATGIIATVEVPMTTNKTLTAIFAESLVTNGTPQAWLAQYGLSTDDAGALSDTDDDGLAAWEEYIAGTLPNLGTSVFEISNHWETPDGSGYVFTWPVVESRIYSVYWSSNLITGIWSQMAGSASGVYTDTVHEAENAGFYRIKVQMSP